MKIIRQSADELVLSEGNASGIGIGAAFVVAGVLVAYIRPSSSQMVIWVALTIVAAGVAVILLSSAITVNASKVRGQLSYEKKRLMGAQNTTYPISDILRIETRRQWRTENNAGPANQGASTPQQVLVAQSVIIFKNGRELPLDHQKTSSTTSVGPVVLMGGQGAEIAMANQVANFLGVPFQEIAPPNMGSGLNINIG